MQLCENAGRAGERPQDRWRLLALIVVGQVMVSMDFSIASVSVPSLARALAVGPTLTQWVLSANALAFGGFLIVGGRLADAYGPRRCFFGGLAFLTGGALVSGFAGGIAILIAARAAGGFGAALAFPAMLSLIMSNFPAGPDRFKALTISTTAQFLGAPLGTIMAGLLIAQIGWRGAFLLNVPIGIMVLSAAPFIVPARPHENAVRQPIDFVGACLVTAGLALFVWTVTTLIGEGRGASGSTLAIFAGSVAILTMFVFQQRASAAPLIAVEVLHSPNFMTAVIIVSVLVTGLAGLIALSNISFQQGLAFTPLEAGFALLPHGLMSVLVSAATPLFAAKLLKIPRTSLIMALLIIGGSHFLISLASSAVGMQRGLLTALVITPIGGVLGINIGIIEGLASVPSRYHGIASAILYAVMQVFLAIAISIILTVSDFGPQAGAAAFSFAGFAPGFRAAALICAAGIAATFFLKETPSVPR